VLRVTRLGAGILDQTPHPQELQARTLTDPSLMPWFLASLSDTVKKGVPAGMLLSIGEPPLVVSSNRWMDGFSAT